MDLFIGLAALYLALGIKDNMEAIVNALAGRKAMKTRIEQLEAENLQLKGDVDTRVEALEDIVTDDDYELNKRLARHDD